MLITSLSCGLLVLPGIIICRWIWDYLAIRRKLSAIPAPKSIPFIGLTWKIVNLPREDRFKWLNNFIGKFKNGIVVLWFGSQPTVTISKPAFMEKVLSSNTLLTKSQRYDALRPWLGNGLLTSTGSVWHKHRKLITPAFHFSILENYAACMRDNVDILVECIDTQLRRKPNTPINIIEFSVRFTLDIICQTAMGLDIDAQRNIDGEYVTALRKFSDLSIERMLRFWLRWDALYFCTPKGRESWRAMKTMHNFTEKVIVRKQLERKNKLSENMDESEIDEFGKRKRKAFLDLLLDESEKAEHPLTFQEIRQEVDTFMFGGHDTTATAIGWTLYALGNEPKIQDKVYDELIEVFGNETETATTKQLGQLKYLERVIKEVSRVYPSVPNIGRYADEDITIDGYFVPKGTTLSMNIYLLHHNPEIWEDPEKFDPDRFLPENIRSKSAYAYIPFSAGPRNCIGQKFAYLELKTALAAILRRWQVSSVLKDSEMKLVSNIILRPHNDKIELYFKPRI